MLVDSLWLSFIIPQIGEVNPIMIVIVLLRMNDIFLLRLGRATGIGVIVVLWVLVIGDHNKPVSSIHGQVVALPS